MDGFTCKEEQIVDILPMLPYGYEETLIPEIIEETKVPHEKTLYPAPVSCHFFFPETEERNGGRCADEEQQDPLAINAEWVNISDCDFETDATLEEELVMSENQPSSSFSIIDPLRILDSERVQIKVEPGTKSVIEPVPEPVDMKPTPAELLEITGKRKSLPESDWIDLVPKKKICLDIKADYTNIVLKKLMVNIGPKLPLPQCFQRVSKVKVCSRLLKCKKCNFTCQDLSELRSHKAEHIVLKIYTCSKCDHKCTDLASHNAHIATCAAKILSETVRKPHIKDGLYWCEFCSFKFKQEHHLRVHEKKHSTEKSFHCHICKNDFLTVDRLRVHCNEDHKKLTKVFSCNLCEYSTMYSTHLKDHMVKHNTDKHLYCSTCRRNCEDSDDCEEHRKVHKTPTIRNCEESQKLKKITTPRTRDEQKDEEENLSALKCIFKACIIKKNNIFRCDVCTYRFSKLNNLIKHKEQHLKVINPFKCACCTYESLSLVELRKHMKIHPKDKTKPTCNVCGHRASHLSHLMRHMVTHLDDGLYCKLCRRNLESADSLKRHLASAHKRTGQRIYSCSKCSFTHSVKYIYKCHLLKCRQSKLDVTNKQNYVKTYKQKTRVMDSTFDEDETHAFCATPVNARPKQTEGIVQECKPKKIEKTNNLHDFVSLPNGKTFETDKLKWAFKCNKCSFTSVQLSLFVQHDKLCNAHRDKPFICNVCTEKTTLIKTYFDHIKGHSGITSYNCRFCQFSCGRKDRFEQHMKNHELKCCPMCVFKTRQMSYLKRHVTDQHKSGNKPFSCSLCPYSSRGESLLSAHSLKFHPKEFASLRLPIPTRLKYLVKHKKVVAHACSICSFRTLKLYDLKRHVIKHFVHGSLSYKSIKHSRGRINKTKKTKRMPDVVKKDMTFDDKRPDGKSTSMSENANVKDHKTLYHYCCSQCQFKSIHRRSIHSHLRAIHNMNGGVRNKMVFKIPITSSQASKTNKKKQNTVPREYKNIKPSASSILTAVKSDKSKNLIIKTCTKCNFDQLSSIAQRNHNKCGHDKYWSKPYACGVCGLRFTNQSSCGRHKLKHGKKTITCNQCNNFVSYRSDIVKNHARTCLKPIKNTTKKKDQNKLFKQTTYKINKEVAESNEVEHNSDDESFSCGECNYVTLNVTDLINHMFIHTGIQDD